MGEYTLININWISFTNEDFQCSRIEELYKNRKDCDVVTKYRRIEKGCGVIGENPKLEIDGVGIYTCLCHKNFKDEIDLHNLIWMYNMYKQGVMGFEGSLLDQPSKYIQTMQLIDRLHIEREIEMNEKANKDKK